jgi:hypothetical protein
MDEEHARSGDPENRFLSLYPDYDESSNAKSKRRKKRVQS